MTEATRKRILIGLSITALVAILPRASLALPIEASVGAGPDLATVVLEFRTVPSSPSR